MDDRQRCDAKLQDVMSRIWKTYRTGSMKEFNDCFVLLHKEYGNDPGIEHFIKCFGFGLAGFKNKWEGGPKHETGQ